MLHNVLGLIGMLVVFVGIFLVLIDQQTTTTYALMFFGFVFWMNGIRVGTNKARIEAEKKAEVRRREWKEMSCPICKSREKFQNSTNTSNRMTHTTQHDWGDSTTYQITTYYVSLSWIQCEKCGWKWNHDTGQGQKIDDRTTRNGHPGITYESYDIPDLIEQYASNSDHPIMAYSHRG